VGQSKAGTWVKKVPAATGYEIGFEVDVEQVTPYLVCESRLLTLQTGDCSIVGVNCCVGSREQSFNSDGCSRQAWRLVVWVEYTSRLVSFGEAAVCGQRSS
jgi:hypothetical protein